MASSVLPYRRRQILDLRRALSAEVPSRPVYVWGDPATGKRSVVHAAIPKACAAREVRVDCVRAHGERALFNAIAAAAVNWPTGVTENMTGVAARSSAGLVGVLDAWLCRTKPGIAGALPPMLVLVLVSAERLSASHFGKDTLRTLLDMPAQLRHPNQLRIVLVSRIPWAVFRNSIVPEARDPLLVHFPAYTENEATKVICNMTSHSVVPPEGLTNPQIANDLYPGFVKAVVGTLFAVTTDIKELARVCVRVYPAYLDPFAQNPEIQISSLWNRVSKQVTKAMRMVYRRDVAITAETDEAPLLRFHLSEDPNVIPVISAVETIGPADDTFGDEKHNTSANSVSRRGHVTSSMDLSRVAKLLLVAAFLGASNEPKTDLHYFSAQNVGRRRRRSTTGKSRGVNKGKGRSSFSSSASVPLNRVVAIFDAIQGVGSDARRHGDGEDDDTPGSAMSTNAYVNLASLAALALVSKDSSGDQIHPKFRCNITCDVAAELAASVGVTLHEFIHVDPRDE
jgi:Origin recognition complex (ORC) subunit 5 C-terminus